MENKVRAIVLSVYYILFGFASIAAELEFERVVNHVEFLRSHCGRGVWYIFLGTLALG